MGSNMEVRREEMVGEVQEVREVSEKCVLLLIETEQEIVYCWLEGELWVRRVRRFQAGQRVAVSAYRWYPVSADTADMYTPPIPGKTIAPGYIHVAASDPDFLILPQIDISYPSLKEACEEAYSNPWTRRDLAGVVLDVVLRRSAEDTFATVKLADERVDSLACGLVVRGKRELGVWSVGDVLVVHGCVWALYGSKPQVSKAANWAVYGYETGRIQGCTPRYLAKTYTLKRVNELQAWVACTIPHHSICPLNELVPNLGSLLLFSFKIVHIIAKIATIQSDFPQGKHTLVLVDEAGSATVETGEGVPEWVSTGIWVKLCHCRIEKGPKLMNCNYMLKMSTSSFDVKTHLRNYHILGDVIEREAVDRLGKQVFAWHSLREEVISHCFDSSLPLWTAAEVLSPLSSRKFVRVKGLFIDLQPADLATAFYCQGSIWQFAGLLRIYSGNAVLNVLLTASEAGLFFHIPSFSPCSLDAVTKQVAGLSQGNRWMELGLYRASTDTVLLRLHATTLLC